MPSPIKPQTNPMNSNWAHLREIQRLATIGDQYAETACIIDLGETVDIHPLRKKEVAERIGLCMDRLVYGKGVALSAQPVGHRVEGAKVTIIFDQPMQSGSVDEVEVAGADGRFVSVKAAVEGAEMTFLSAVTSPVCVRYAWKDNPVHANLHAVSGLPAMPFEYQLDR